MRKSERRVSWVGKDVQFDIQLIQCSSSLQQFATLTQVRIGNVSILLLLKIY